MDISIHTIRLGSYGVLNIDLGKDVWHNREDFGQVYRVALKVIAMAPNEWENPVWCEPDKAPQ